MQINIFTLLIFKLYLFAYSTYGGTQIRHVRGDEFAAQIKKLIP
jgi:hypothetical protein